MKPFSKFLLMISFFLGHSAWGNADSGMQNEKRFIIAIIDTGIDMKNETLKKQLCVNSGETGLDKKGHDKSVNGIDDDDNGYTDDLHGWSFYDASKNVHDRHGHGTHIAGILLDELKKLKLESQFCFQILKYYDSDEPSENLLQASNDSFKYASRNRSQLINYSGGGYSFNQEESKWIQELANKKVPVVAAMGNQKINTDTTPFYPASYDIENIFAIAAADNNQFMAPFSNYGKKHFDFLAPGVAIESFGLNNSRAFLSGTSQATAKVSAMLAYLMYQDKNQNNWIEIKKNIKNLRTLSLTKTKKGNPTFVDTPFIQKFKTSAVDAFGEP